MTVKKKINGSFTFKEVSDHLKARFGVKTDADVARQLGLDTTDFHNRKRRGAIPWEYIVAWCRRNESSMDWLLGRGGDNAPNLEVLKLAEAINGLPEEKRRAAMVLLGLGE
ncbi:MAG: helix-turn-helix domain-containing protein [Proteobacteria bacterium]|nr:helix-turn-helix domain-containing protein [Pseudomonadota bacterium]MBU1742460.1 helix-turn-helix domain-containing protein [Pseudomonadota bacterium]